MKADMRELGDAGLKRQNGVIYEEYLPELQGYRWMNVIRRMVDDPIVGAVLFAIEMTMRQVAWQVRANNKDPQGDEMAEFITECMEDMSFTWSDILGEVLTMLPYGYSFLEVVYKMRGGPSHKDPRYRSRFTDGKIGWRKWASRSQDTLSSWKFDTEGGIQGFVQSVPNRNTTVTIPIEKGLLFRTTVRKNSPEGRSVLRSAYRPFYFKQNVENIEGIGIERDLAGLPIAWVPPQVLSSSASAEERAVYTAMQDLVVNIRQDAMAGVVFPLAYDDNGNKIYDLTLLSSGGGKQFDTGAVIGRYEARIAMSVMSDFLLIGHEKQGSFALSTSKVEMFITALRSWLDVIADVINRYAIPRLMEANGMDITNPPVFVHGDVGRIDLDALGQYIVRLSSAGFQLNLDEELENYLRQQANLPLQDVNATAPSTTQPKLSPVGDNDGSTPADATHDVANGQAGKTQQDTAGTGK